jgi:hypothetical protein
MTNAGDLAGENIPAVPGTHATRGSNQSEALSF